MEERREGGEEGEGGEKGGRWRREGREMEERREERGGRHCLPLSLLNWTLFIGAQKAAAVL